jgi:hypothetical protein
MLVRHVVTLFQLYKLFSLQRELVSWNGYLLEIARKPETGELEYEPSAFWVKQLVASNECSSSVSVATLLEA